MNITAIICEYNPFHNGHATHLSRAREMTGARYVVCVMSGSWMQRGEPAIVDKWTRAKMALEGGADLVLELPSAYAIRSARDFAAGAVALLNGLGVCTHLSFGSELPLENLRERLTAGEDEDAIREALRRGESYPRAVSGGDASAAPNATLGLEYLRALEDSASSIQPVVVRRTASHHEEDILPMTSASAIRKATKAGLPVREAMPSGAFALYERALQRQGGPADWERVAPLVLHILRSAGAGRLKAAYGVAEGLENRLTRSAKRSASVQELFDSTKCKRYTHARIRRAVAHIVLGIAPGLLEEPPSCARVLGFRSGSAALLAEIGERGSLPLVTKLQRNIEDAHLAQDIAAQELWTLTCPAPMPAGMDYTHPIQIV